jgi:hypothetical protein
VPVPDENNMSTADTAKYVTFTFQVQDNGGTVGFDTIASTADDGVDLDQSPNTFTVVVTPVNDAPVLQNASTSVPALTTITENVGSDNGVDDNDSNAASLNDGDDDATANTNTNNNGNLLSNLIRAVDASTDASAVTSKSFASDVDFFTGGTSNGSSPNEAQDNGVAIYGLSNTGPADGGVWQFSTNAGSTWTAINTTNMTNDVANATALLLRSTDKIRFVPDTDNGTTATVSYVLWDGLLVNDATKYGTYTSIASRGGITNFSEGNDTATIAVTHVNDNPVLDLDSTTASSSSTAYTTTFRPRGDAVAVVGSHVVITDVDKLATGPDYISGAVVTIATGAVNNIQGTIYETLSAKTGGANGTPISSYAGSAGAIAITGNGSTTITLSGKGTWADYQTALQTVYYNNTNTNAATGNRTITVTLTDGALTVGEVVGSRLPSNVATTTVQVPWTTVVDLNGSGTGRDHAATYTEDETGVAVATPDASLDNQSINIKTVVLTLNNHPDGATEKLWVNSTDIISGLGLTMTSYLTSLGITSSTLPACK